MTRLWGKAGRRMLVAAIGVLYLLTVPVVWAPATAWDEEKGDQVLRVQQRYYPASLDPQLSSGLEFAAILGANYEGLTRLNAQLNVVPGAAETWEISDDGRTLTFTLRDGLTYSDGTPLDAGRFVDTIRRGCDPYLPGDYQHILFAITGCEALASLFIEEDGGTPAVDHVTAYETALANLGVRAIDARTLEIELDHPAPYFVAMTSLPIFYPAKQELIAQGGDGWWRDPAALVGNGPFQVMRLEADQMVVLAPNERYWGGRPRLDRLEYVFVADSTVALEAYQTGDLDIIALDASFMPLVEDDVALRDQLVRVPAAATSYLSFNLTQEPFTDRKVREAFAYGFDRETYCLLLRGGSCIPTLTWIPPDVPGHVTTTAYAFDPEQARQALAESSYGGPEGLPEVTLVYWNEDAMTKDWSEWIAGQYRDVLGVAITLQPMEGKMMVDAMSEPSTYPQLVITGWVQDYPDPHNWLSVYWTCKASYAQDAGYCNPEFDALIARADREEDAEARMALYEAAGEVLVQDVPGVFLSHGVFNYLVKPEVSGITTTPLDAAWPGMTTSLLTLTKG